MTAGQIVWDEVRRIAGRHSPLPSDREGIVQAFAPLVVPEALEKTLEGIVEVYNGVVIDAKMALSNAGFAAYIATCIRAVQELGQYEKKLAIDSQRAARRR